MTPRARFYCHSGFFLLLLFLVYLGVAFRMQLIANADPDRYFHLAISKLTAKQGLVRTLPQVENLGWGESYPNPYFLFSWVSGVLERVGGEKFVLFLVPAIVFLFLTLVFFILGQFSPAPIAFCLSLFLLLTPLFSLRLVLYRPHLFAMTFSLGIVFALLKEKIFLVGLFCFLFGISYHGLYIPVAFLIAFVVTHRRGQTGKLLLSAALGLVLSLFLNPYFPDPIVSMARALLSVVPSGSIKNDLRPVEALPLSFQNFVLNFGGYLVILGVSAKKSFEKIPKTADFWFFFGLSVLFWILSFRSQRSLEYALPLTACLAAVAFSKKQWLGVPVAFQVVAALSFFLSSMKPIVNPATRFDPIAQLPAAPGKKVMNCEWYISSFILYKRPDLRFVDIGDPSALFGRFPLLFQLREMLREGKLSYPFGVIRYAFDSDYVLCEHPLAIAQMERDPRFKRLYPTPFVPEEKRQRGFVFLFEASQKPLPNDVFDFEGFRSTGEEKVSEELSPWKDIQFGESAVRGESRSPYFDLRRWLNEAYPHRPSQDKDCVVVRPQEKEIERHLGKTHLGFGGGTEVTLWQNGKLLVKKSFSQNSRILSQFLPLFHPLQKNDAIQAEICSPPVGPFGFSLSFWNLNEISQICRQKGYGQPNGKMTCLGPLQ